mmetsp:Transcript_18150/g.25836  ORF Transcript_18150/g.25836 Transcript_18150/m.25836 type:complete len:475 (+) Transcript_18150:162-1586(+)
MPRTWNTVGFESRQPKKRAPITIYFLLVCLLGSNFQLVSALSNTMGIKNNVKNNRFLSSRHERYTAAGSRYIQMSLSATVIPHTPSNLAVSLTRPLIDPSAHKSRYAATQIIKKLFISIFCCDNVRYRYALATFFVAFFLSILSRCGIVTISVPSVFKHLLSARDNNGNNTNKIGGGIKQLLNLARGQFIRVADRLQQIFENSISDPGIPMPFDDTEGDGWGKCILRSKKAVGSSDAFVQYDFDLPQKDFVLPLQLGQKLTLCCLDEDNNVAKGEFYLFSPRDTKGSFSIVAPCGQIEKADLLLGKDNAKFANVLENELRVGDEVAVKPGPKTLYYNGQYWPVTDIVFLVYGSGIIPIIDQVKSVLPSSSSTSVKSASVTWVNSDSDAFDLAVSQLESEFYKYNQKLDVSCCLAILLNTNRGLEDYPDIEQSIPNFSPGTMAVISGPSEFSEKASAYLQSSRNYPMDCICTLPP